MSKEVYGDINNIGNSPSWHTGKNCIEHGCSNKAGTAWSPHWCFECNVERMDRVTKNLHDLLGGIPE